MRVDGDRMELSFHLVQRCVLFESCVMRTLFLMKPNTISHGLSSNEYVMVVVVDDGDRTHSFRHTC